MSISTKALAVGLLSGLILYLPHLLTPKLPPVSGGNATKDFSKVEKIFREAIEDGSLKGGALSVYYQGKRVVNQWGGYADVTTRKPWTEDTLTVFFSTTKLFGSLIVAQMVDKGLLDYTRPVSEYWPEFGQNGKEKVTVEMLLSHQAGLSVLDESVSMSDIQNHPEKVASIVAKQKPMYKPGSKFGYHSLTFGLYVDTLIQKVDPEHRNVSRIFQEDIATPFGIDFYIGLPRQLYYRKTRTYIFSLGETLWSILTSGDILNQLWYFYKSTPFPESNLYKSSTAISDLLANQYMMDDPDKIAIGVTSFVGVGSANGVAKVLSILSTGGKYDGKQLLSTQGIASLGTELAAGDDDTFHLPIRLGPGTMLSRNPKGKTIFGHSGFGAQLGFVDPYSEISFAFCTNHLTIFHIWNHPLTLRIQDAVYDAIKDMH